ncbi:MAG: carboxylesterase family protein [Solirubrobacteraceae bacterium]|nr:carboxylesterase family protein [Solirubrobacteraceae bacterium]
MLEIGCGRLQGAPWRDGAVHAWRGVPYASPPVGARRFAAPVPHPGWAGVRDATAGGSSAPQPVPMRPGPLSTWLSARRSRSEDCLFLDVWAPVEPASPRPVVVWIHGGSFTTGAGSEIDASRLADEGDVVVVTVNYRLGGLGFVDVGDAVGGDERIVSNPGLRDQLAALEWVRDHIGAFGGDPARVTIAGESAGSASVTLLATSPRARGLFRGVIAQSGALTLAIDRDDAARNARVVLDELGVSRERIDELWRRPASAIVAATARAQRRRTGALVTRPWWDDDLLPASLADGYASFAPVPLLIGSNADEHRTFTRLRKDVMPLTREALGTVLVESLGVDHAGRVLAEYPEGADGLNDLGSDLVFGMPSVHLAERQAAHTSSYLYRLDFASRLRALGSFHAIELTQLFPSDPRVDRLLFGRPSAERDAFGADLRARWLQFVREGQPGDDWPVYDPGGDRLIRRWNLSSATESDPWSARRRAWAGRDVTIH